MNHGEHLPEFSSIEAFLQFCEDDEKTTFLPGDAQKIAAATRQSTSDVVKILVSKGLKVRTNEIKSVRGITSNPHGTNRWTGEGNTFTTPGTDNITGFAGREGN